MFLGDCENRLVLVKILEAPAELPDTALIGRLNHYGRVLSFRRDKIADTIDKMGFARREWNSTKNLSQLW